jgi:catechol 2,3-dioxygenase-like lactoylglutathione lyase family enzyme
LCVRIYSQDANVAFLCYNLSLQHQCRSNTHSAKSGIDRQTMNHYREFIRVPADLGIFGILIGRDRSDSRNLGPDLGHPQLSQFNITLEYSRVRILVVPLKITAFAHERNDTSNQRNYRWRIVISALAYQHVILSHFGLIKINYCPMPKEFQLNEQPLVAFIATGDPVRAKQFYGETLGLPLFSDELPFALVFDARGTMLRVTVVKEVKAAAYTVLGWQVTDIRAAANGLRKAGVQFERYPGMQQDELGIWTSPGGSKIAWFKDPDGNTLSISE